MCCRFLQRGVTECCLQVADVGKEELVPRARSEHLSPTPYTPPTAAEALCTTLPPITSYMKSCRLHQIASFDAPVARR